MQTRVLMFSLVVIAGLSGCTSNPARDIGQTASPPPNALAAQPHSHPKGGALSWGGVVVEVRNLADRTVLEVLSYPLNGAGKPDTRVASQGRFLAEHQGFLEPREFAPGRMVTVSGPLLGYQDGQVAGTQYRFPAISSDELRLWDIEQEASGFSWRKPRVGVGVNVGSGGRSGVGVNIGF